MHFRKLFDNRFIGSWDLEGRESITLEIKEVKVEEVQNTTGKVEKRPVLHFAGTKTDKGMVLNKTNAKAIAAEHGTNVDDWVGKKIKLVVRPVSAFGSTTDALRVEV